MLHVRHQIIQHSRGQREQDVKRARRSKLTRARRSLIAQRTAILARIRAADKRAAIPINPDRLATAQWFLGSGDNMAQLFKFRHYQ